MGVMASLDASMLTAGAELWDRWEKGVLVHWEWTLAIRVLQQSRVMASKPAQEEQRLERFWTQRSRGPVR